MDWDRQSAADPRFFLVKRIVLDFAMRGTELPRYLVSYPSKQRGDSKIEKFLNLPSRCRSDTEKAAQLQQTAQLVNILAISARFSSTDQTAPKPPPPPPPAPLPAAQRTGTPRLPQPVRHAPVTARRAAPAAALCRAGRSQQPHACSNPQRRAGRSPQCRANGSTPPQQPEAKNRSHVERWP